MNILNEKQLKQLFKRERKTKNMFRRLRSALVLTVDVDLKRIVTCELDSEKKGNSAKILFEAINNFRHVHKYAIERHN